MEANGKYRYLAKNTLLFTISSFGSKILVFLLVPLYTSVLTTAEYGIADIITTSSSLLMYIFTINIADAVLRFAIEEEHHPNRILSYGVRVFVVGSCALAVITIVIWKLKLIKWEEYCYLFLFLVFFAVSLYHILSSYLRAVDKIKEVAISGIITTLVTIISNILLLLVFDLRILGYLISFTAGSFVSSLYCLTVIKIPPRSLWLDCCDRNLKGEMRRYSIPLIFNGTAWWVSNSIDKYFVIWMCGASMNGLVSVAYKIPTILTVFNRIFSQAWNLSAIKEFDKNDSDGFFSKVYYAYNAGLVIICSGLILLNIPIARILFAKDFFVAWQYSSILLLSTLFGCLSGILGSVFTAVKNSKIFAYSTVVAAVINCILNVILIYFFGATGAVVATAASFFCVWIIRLFYARKYIKMKINLGCDTLAYSLIVVQIVLEHLQGHYYIGQSVIFIVLLFMYKSFVFSITNLVKRQFRRKVS